MRRGISIAGLMAMATLAVRAETPLHIEVFTDATHFPVTRAGPATVHDLSAPRRLEAALGQGLPRDPTVAEVLARARIAGAAESLRAAYAGPAQALRYRLAKIPAVVFDRGAAVVYGVPDVAEATRLYQRWKAAR
jgi:integrating conjugative element protein (TIGR03757 family)